MKFAAQLLVSLVLASVALIANAASVINTIGSKEGIAINGYDTVAFFTSKKAVAGKPELSYEWEGAKWLFSTEENLKQFQQEPTKWAPQYGGHCALGVSENYISKKATSGRFDIKDEKLYLFPSGNNNPDGAYNDWWRGGGPSRRITDADKNWLQLKQSLEASSK